MTERQTRLAVPTEPPSASRAPKAPTRPRALALAAVLAGSLAALGLCLYAAAGLVEAPWPQTAFTALLLAACCSLLSTMMTSWHGILIMRALIGLSLSGVAAVGMTYLSEEIHPSFVAFSMGLYISGNSIGGMSGRLGSLPISSAGAWRWRRSAALRWPRRLCSGVSCPSRAISARPRCDRKRC